MEVNPMPDVVKTLKKQAQKSGLTLNAYLTPFLNDIAAGLITRVATTQPPPVRKAA